MNAAFYADLPRYIVSADSLGYAIRHVSRPPRPHCVWVVDPISRKPIAVWTAETDYLISVE